MRFLGRGDFARLTMVLVGATSHDGGVGFVGKTYWIKVGEVYKLVMKVDVLDVEESQDWNEDEQKMNICHEWNYHT